MLLPEELTFLKYLKQAKVTFDPSEIIYNCENLVADHSSYLAAVVC